MTILSMYVWHMWPPNLDISNKNTLSSNQWLSTKKGGDGDDQLTDQLTGCETSR